MEDKQKKLTDLDPKEAVDALKEIGKSDYADTAKVLEDATKKTIEKFKELKNKTNNKE